MNWKNKLNEMMGNETPQQKQARTLAEMEIKKIDLQISNYELAIQKLRDKREKLEEKL